VLSDRTSVVELDRVLYGTVQASARWYDELRTTLEADGSIKNVYVTSTYTRLGARSVSTAAKSLRSI